MEERKKITTMTKCWTRRHGVRTEWTGRFGGGRRRLSGSRKLRRPCRGSFWGRLCRIRRCRAWRWTIARWVRSRRAARRPGSPSAPASARLRDWWCWGGRAEGRGSRRGSSRRGSRAALRSSRSSRRRWNRRRVTAGGNYPEGPSVCVSSRRCFFTTMSCENSEAKNQTRGSIWSQSSAETVSISDREETRPPFG